MYKLHTARLKLLQHEYSNLQQLASFNLSKDLEKETTAEPSQESILANIIHAFEECTTRNEWFHKALYQRAKLLAQDNNFEEAKKLLQKFFGSKRTAIKVCKIHRVYPGILC